MAACQSSRVPLAVRYSCSRHGTELNDDFCFASLFAANIRSSSSVEKDPRSLPRNHIYWAISGLLPPPSTLAPSFLSRWRRLKPGSPSATDCPTTTHQRLPPPPQPAPKSTTSSRLGEASTREIMCLFCLKVCTRPSNRGAKHTSSRPCQDLTTHASSSQSSSTYKSQ